MAKAVKIKQIKSSAQVADRQKKTLKAIGLTGVGSEIYRSDTRALRGMLNTVRSLIVAEQTERSAVSRPKKVTAKPSYKIL